MYHYEEKQSKTILIVLTRGALLIIGNFGKLLNQWFPLKV